MNRGPASLAVAADCQGSNLDDLVGLQQLFRLRLADGEHGAIWIRVAFVLDRIRDTWSLTFFAAITALPARPPRSSRCQRRRDPRGERSRCWSAPADSSNRASEIGETKSLP